MPTKRTDPPKNSTLKAEPAAFKYAEPDDPGDVSRTKEATGNMKYTNLASKMTIRVGTVNPLPMSAWLKITSQKSGHFVYLPLPIRLIQQIPDEKGGGCLIRGAQGDEATAKENIVEVLAALNGYPVGGDVSSWSLAG